MGASRKLQGEIDRVLKKVQEGVDVFDSIWNKVYDTDNANQKEKFEADLKKEIKKLQRYRDQIKTWIQSSEIKDKKALLDARKQIEREMERFKVCEKETKTKAFSKEGLGQQPKTDPKEKAKSETRDWLNNVVSELESQVDYHEAEIESLSVKKGKARPPRLSHLETSITRHKAHIMKLELILRLLDNDQLSPEQVNDIRDFIDDYVERNQDDFEEFSDVDELYCSLPLDELHEDLVTIAPPGLVKDIGVTSAVLSLKTSAAASPAQASATLPSAIQLVQELVEESASLDNNSDVAPRTPSSKSGLSAPSTPAGSHPAAATGNVFGRTLVGPSAPVVPVRVDNSAAIVSSSPVNVSVAAKEDEHTSYPDRRASPGLVGRTSLAGGGASSQSLTSTPLSSGIEIPSPAYLGASEMIKRNILAPDDKIGSGGMSMQPLISPLGNRMLMPQAAKSSDGAGSGSADSSNVGDTSVLGGRAFSPTMVPGTQWRPQSGNSFPNSTDGGQFRGRSEFPPDQREKYLQRFQQVQQGQSNLLGAPHLAGGKQFSTQQQSSLLQQFNSQSSSLSPQVGLGVQQSGLNSASLQQPNSINQFSSQHALMSPGLKDSDLGHMQVDEQQQQRNPSDESRMEATIVSGHNKNLINEDDLKTPYVADTPAGGPSSLTEATQGLRDSDFSPGQPIPPNQPSSLNLGIIGRRSVSDLGAIGDNLTPGSTSYSGVGMNEQLHNLQMLEAAYYKLPTPKDSERARTYIPRHPIATPSSYPQVQAPIIHNPALWERLVLDNIGTDTLFFAFYYQQNTYQQYLAARELKKQSWRYHRKYNTWFQRHENPKVTTDEYEQGTYVYFDFHIANDDLEHGWCQRIKTQFTFEYSFLEDELIT